jgi:predicted TIM-barrel fold metal-dependent hydrolase
MGRHTPNTSDRVESALLGLADEPNVMFETSTVRDPAIIARAIEIVGPDRVAFGSDNPFNSYQDADPLGVELDVIAQTGLSAEVQAKILGGNMAAYLGIEEAMA